MTTQKNLLDKKQSLVNSLVHFFLVEARVLERLRETQKKTSSDMERRSEIDQYMFHLDRNINNLYKVNREGYRSPSYRVFKKESEFDYGRSAFGRSFLKILEEEGYFEALEVAQSAANDWDSLKQQPMSYWDFGLLVLCTLILDAINPILGFVYLFSSLMLNSMCGTGAMPWSADPNKTPEAMPEAELKAKFSGLNFFDNSTEKEKQSESWSFFDYLPKMS